MSTGPFIRRVFRKVLIVLCAGCLLGVGSGCDPTVRTTVLSGFQGLATSLVTAFFQGIAVNDTTGTTTTN